MAKDKWEYYVVCNVLIFIIVYTRTRKRFISLIIFLSAFKSTKCLYFARISHCIEDYFICTKVLYDYFVLDNFCKNYKKKIITTKMDVKVWGS